MDFELSEEQKSLQPFSRENFAMEEMLPEVAELEKATRRGGQVPLPIW